MAEAAELLEVSYRQAKGLKKRYGEGGTQALVHGNVGRGSNRADPKRCEQILGLVRENYSGEPPERFGPTLASEHLVADDGLAVRRETLRCWMLAAGLWSRRRKRKPHRSAARTPRPLRRADSTRRFAPRLARRTRSERLSDELRRRCDRLGAMPFLEPGNDLGGSRSAPSLGA